MPVIDSRVTGIREARHSFQAAHHAPRFPPSWPEKTWCRWSRNGRWQTGNVGN